MLKWHHDSERKQDHVVDTLKLATWHDKKSKQTAPQTLYLCIFGLNEEIFKCVRHVKLSACVNTSMLLSVCMSVRENPSSEHALDKSNLMTDVGDAEVWHL